MKNYLLQRLGIAALTLFGMSLVIFVLLRLAPGDIVDILFSTGGYVNPSERAAIEKELGLDKPLINQYLSFMGHLFEGKPGISLINGQPITTTIGRAGLQTLKLGAAATLLTYLIAIPLGLLAAWRRNSALDQGTMAVAVLGMGIPNFFLAILLIQLFSIHFQWLPDAGSGFQGQIAEISVRG